MRIVVNWIRLLFAVFICELVGNVGSLFTLPALASWYPSLIKPSFNPPAWLFGPVWLALYLLMGVSLYLIWSARTKASNHSAELLAFGVQLALNLLWSFLFFGLRSPLYGLVGIVLLWASILATIILFAKVSKPAAYLLSPYILWVSFALVLNYSIWTLN